MDEKQLVDGATALAEKQSRVIKIEPAEQPQNMLLRVAAYTRVSSDSEDQLNSFAAQNRYYTELISGKAEWRMVDIYADEGITGTSVAKRDDFQRMMADCRRGLIDQILVKSISRFARNSLIRQITDAMETEIIPFPGGTMSLGDIERRLRELEQQFQTLLEKATDDPAAYGGQFKEILDEQTFLKEKRSVILANNNEQAKANQRIMDAAQTLENASPYITEWDESAVRQLVETVKILSKDEVAVTLKGGIEICQKIMY
mgnify:CR=1 FL=1